MKNFFKIFKSAKLLFIWFNGFSGLKWSNLILNQANPLILEITVQNLRKYIVFEIAYTLILVYAAGIVCTGNGTTGWTFGAFGAD